MHQLYSFRRCPYAIRTRMILRYSSIKVELREIVLNDKPEAMMQLTPRVRFQYCSLIAQRYLTRAAILLPGLYSRLIRKICCIAVSRLCRHKCRLWLMKTIMNSNYGWIANKYSDRYPQQSQIVYQQRGLEFLTGLNRKLGTILRCLAAPSVGLILRYFPLCANLPLLIRPGSISRTWSLCKFGWKVI